MQIANGVLMRDRPQKPTVPASTPFQGGACNMYGDNIMEEVAKALGVELGEPFCVENSTDNHIDWFRFTIDGAQHFSPDPRGFATLQGHKGDWCMANYVLGELLVGKRMRIRRKIEQEMLF